jgi:hypothetical protein
LRVKATSSTYALNHGFSYDANHNLTFWNDKVSNAYACRPPTTVSIASAGFPTTTWAPATSITTRWAISPTTSSAATRLRITTPASAKRLDCTSGSKAYTFAYDDRGNVNRPGYSGDSIL